jgi:hypothetical protein
VVFGAFPETGPDVGTKQLTWVSHWRQTATVKLTYRQLADPLGLDFMPIHYLHLAAFICEACNGPVISGSFATRETEIQRESDIREIGSICLYCGKHFSSLPTSRPVRHMAPLEWGSREPALKQKVSAREPGSVVKDYIQ